MARCPKCGAEINHLINECATRSIYRFFSQDGEAEYERYETISDFLWDNDYKCPRCDERLFSDEEEEVL